MKNQTMKFTTAKMPQILRSPRWLAMMFLLPLLAMFHFAMAAPSAPVAEKFDHANIGFTLSGAHASARCTACHINNVFKGTPRDCATCHIAGNHMGATAKPAKHVATNVQCDVCHKTTLWTPAFFSHVGIAAGTCSTCHNNAAAKGKNPNSHMPTTQDCSDCHTSVSFTPLKSGAVMLLPVGNPPHVPTTQPCSLCHNSAAFVPAFTMDHSGITGSCETCHNGTQFLGTKPRAKQDAVPTHMTTTLSCNVCHTTATTFKLSGTIVLPMPAGHMPSNMPCATCHTASVGFGPGSGSLGMSHQGIANNCASCHNGQSFALGQGVTPKAKPTNHINTSAACELCHSPTSTSAGGFVTTTMVHAGITSNCANCHNNQAFVGVPPMSSPVSKPSNHFTTSGACELCHSPTSTNTGGFVTATMVHTGITANCADCHSGTQTFAGTPPMSSPVAKSTGSPAHIPTALACETCHAVSKTNVGGFVGTGMNHVGIVGNCAQCHYDGASFSGIIPIKRKQDASPTHLTTAVDCSGCHTSVVTFKGAGTAAMPTGHLATTQVCSLCHAAGYGPGQGAMNHTGIVNNCSSCHDGQTFAVNMTPKNKSFKAGHITTTSDCSVCHTSTVTFVGGTGGSLPAGHLVTTQACSVCHAAGYSTALTVMSHVGIVSNCATCHDGQTFAVGMKPVSKPSGSLPHIPTTMACEVCHLASKTSVGGFAGTTMVHTGITNNCASCHNDGMSFAGVTPKRKQDAAVAHLTTTQDCSVCHSSTTTFTTATPVLPTGHLVTAMPCSTCHAAGYSLTLTKMSHVGIVSGCANCHNGQTFAVNMTPKNKSDFPTHMATTLDCSACHSTTNFTSFAGGSGGGVKPANHIPTSQACTLCHSAGYSLTTTVMNHTGITTGCVNCHNGQVFAGPQTPMVKSTKHIPYATALLNGSTMQCEICHKDTASFQNNQTGAILHNSSPGHGSGQCTGCHLKGTTYTGNMTRMSLTHDSPGHTDCSDSGCHKPLGNTGSSWTRWK